MTNTDWEDFKFRAKDANRRKQLLIRTLERHKNDTSHIALNYDIGYAERRAGVERRLKDILASVATARRRVSQRRGLGSGVEVGTVADWRQQVDRLYDRD